MKDKVEKAVTEIIAVEAPIRRASLNSGCGVLDSPRGVSLVQHRGKSVIVRIDVNSCHTYPQESNSMPVENFFDERSDQSAKKTLIVGKYFASWANVMLHNALNKPRRLEDISLGYVDFCAGPGRYKDSSESTPLIVLRHIMSKPKLAATMRCRFYDEKPEFVQALRSEIANLPGIETLRYQPQISLQEITDAQTVALTAPGRSYPTLYFLDPFGYKEITQRLIGTAIASFGCDCIFFFNSRRVNAAITNTKFMEHMDALFGVKNLEELREKVRRCRWPGERLQLVIDHLKIALKNANGEYSVEYRFNDDAGHPSHFLMMTSKARLAHDIMKEIMAHESTGNQSKVPSFHYHPFDEHREGVQPLFDMPMVTLKDQLRNEFENQAVSFKELFSRHSIGKPYMKQNYCDALLELEGEGKVDIFPPANQRWKRGRLTCSGDDIITFPKRESNGK